MKNYAIWNKQTPINGVSAQHFLSKPPFKGYNGDIILIYNEDKSRVTNVEGKDILAKVYGIDSSLSLDEFMSAYFTKINQSADNEIGG